MKDLTNRVQYYYDSHSTEEDLIPETSWHSTLVDYLKAVLTWLFRGQECAIYHDLAFYQTYNAMEYPLAPDLAVIKGMPFHHMTSWAVGRGLTVPQAVFEILSKETWEKDLREKPTKYAHMGVQEYFAYDPNEPPLRRATTQRLWGWRLNAQRTTMVEIARSPSGWLWSDELDSWLVADQSYLRLYDRDHQLRLTGEEAQAQRAEMEAEKADEAIRKAQALAAKLRSLGIDPDEP